MDNSYKQVRYKQLYSKHKRTDHIERMTVKKWDHGEEESSRSESVSEDDDDETCGIFCFGLGLILMFVGVAVLATVIVYNQSDQNPRRVVALTSTRTVRPVSEELTRVLDSPKSLVVFTDMDLHKEQVSDKKFSLLVIVHSLPGSSKLRAAIRDTWYPRDEEKNSDIVIFFSVPAKDLPTEGLASLREESRIHKDMVIFPQSRSLPESELLLFEWVWSVKMYDFHYLLKVRDSMYVNVRVLMTDVVHNLKEKGSNAYLGYFEGNKDPRDTGKPKEPDWFLCDRYIRYAHSGGYILSEVLVKRLLRQAKYLHPYNNEDVALGTWLSPFNDIDLIHDTRFDTEIGHPRGCKNGNLIFQTDNNADNMIAVHHKFLQRGRYCDAEVDNIPTYRYDFDTLPSQCCTPIY